MNDSASTRRAFLQQSLALVAATPAVPALLSDGSTDPNDRNTLVVVQLVGGNDGLNTVVPYRYPRYYLGRPTLHLDPTLVHPLTDSVGLHPNLDGLLDLYRRGHMAVIPSVGYGGAGRSHFRASDAWHSGQPDREQPLTGWLGRYLDAAGGACVHFGDTPPLSLQGERVTPTTLGRSEYAPGGFADALRQTAAMIRRGGPTRVYSLELHGFDTHTHQRNRHDRLMRTFGDAVGAFWRELRAHRVDGHVLMLVFSEFGRSVAENAGGGTDHGAAGPVFLFGPAVRGGVHVDGPSLTDLHDGGLKHAFDFRRVYATLLERWLGADSAPLLGGRFGVLPVLG
jgi:uncharacterized protein (DUF1501 family)